MGEGDPALGESSPELGGPSRSAPVLLFDLPLFELSELGAEGPSPPLRPSIAGLTPSLA